MSEPFVVDEELVRQDQVGDIITHTDGTRWIVTKRTARNMVVVQYHWYNAAVDWIVGKTKELFSAKDKNSRA